MGKSKRPLGLTDIGSFEIRSGRIGAWDPCYGRGDTWKCRDGKWNARVLVTDEKDWGHRIASLHAWADGVKPGGPLKEVAVAGVDSGQMGIYDAGQLGPDVTSESDYGRICNRTLSGLGAGTLPYGVVSSSGFGDGGYGVFIRTDDEGKVIELMVEFIPDDEDFEDREGLEDE